MADLVRGEKIEYGLDGIVDALSAPAVARFWNQWHDPTYLNRRALLAQISDSFN
ncbi:hypothetical protein [Mesorhizobium sp. M0959]|uniref:hypothetical protein n=1 Tax=unclassified Mesorhizobium TaxID=325217 RepID=UPI00333AC065